MSIKRRWIDYVMLGFAFILGTGSLLLFGIFLIFGSFNFVDIGLSNSAILCFDAFLCCAFFVQHSGMVRKSFRQRLARWIPPIYDNAFYAIASGLILLVLVFFWQESPDALFSPTGLFRWLFHIVLCLSGIGILWGFQALGAFDPFGFTPILDRLLHKKTLEMPFTIRGPYRWVRHPLYTFSILIIWSYPELTYDRVLFNLMFTVWIIMATKLEENDLLNAFGESYQDYQSKAPMLIPNRIFPIC